jgi:hypothetical protein
MGWGGPFGEGLRKFTGRLSDSDSKSDDQSGEEKNSKAKSLIRDFVGSFKRGGAVKKTGLAKLHKGERVLTKAQAKRYGRKGRGKS